MPDCADATAAGMVDGECDVVEAAVDQTADCVGEAIGRDSG